MDDYLSSYGYHFSKAMCEWAVSMMRDRNGTFEPLAVPRHAHRGFSLEKLVISLYAKGISVSDIEEEMRDIYLG